MLGMSRAIEFPCYLIVGMVATAVHYLALMTLVETGMAPPAIAAMLGALLGAIAAYAGNRTFTFPDAKRHHTGALPRFLLVASMGAIVSGAVVRFGVESLHVHYLPSQVIATTLALFLTFGCNRAWTFS